MKTLCSESERATVAADTALHADSAKTMIKVFVGWKEKENNELKAELNVFFSIQVDINKQLEGR